jgi:dephospho-CoA kinase
MAERPYLLGLTGSIGMGKSETAKMFARIGFDVYDADAAVHALYEPGGAAVEPLSKIFPNSVANGRIDRIRLAEAVGGNAISFAQLESIVHPLAAREMERFIERTGVAGKKVAVLNIPLLFEIKAETGLDAVVVVSAPAEVQRTRVLARPGMTEIKFNRLLARQMPDAEKRRRADFVIDTGQGLDHAFAAVESIAAIVRMRAEGRGRVR